MQDNVVVDDVVEVVVEVFVAVVVLLVFVRKSAVPVDVVAEVAVVVVCGHQCRHAWQSQAARQFGLARSSAHKTTNQARSRAYSA